MQCARCPVRRSGRSFSGFEVLRQLPSSGSRSGLKHREEKARAPIFAHLLVLTMPAKIPMCLCIALLNCPFSTRFKPWTF